MIMGCFRDSMIIRGWHVGSDRRRKNPVVASMALEMAMETGSSWALVAESPGWS